jgi:hypothetical protein
MLSDIKFDRDGQGNEYEVVVTNPQLGDVKVATFIVDEKFQDFLNSGQYTNTVKDGMDMKRFWKGKILRIDPGQESMARNLDVLIEKAKKLQEKDALKFQTDEASKMRINFVLDQSIINGNTNNDPLHDAVASDYKRWQQSTQSQQKSPVLAPTK